MTPFFDARALLDRPAFWAVHLGLSLGDELDDALAALFGAGLGLIRGTYLRLTDTAGWPVFDAGGGLSVVYRNEEVDYLLSTGGGGTITLGVAEGVPDGPGLSWPELQAVATQQPDELTRARTLLLLAPLLGDSSLLITEQAHLPGHSSSAEPAGLSDRPGPVGLTSRAVLARALRCVGVAGDVTTVAGRLVAAQPARWRDEAGVRVCDHAGSTRNPHSARALTSDDLRTVSTLLSPPA
ncbi:hypothetical protein FB565_007960 [Actinoplanes lutulentus]|uniref:Uncharacterized protein n=1 Tax=Actinoplanes lutulentus TaxID=1287878 RepID=A0A327Z4T5_9ACTN|nr:hypothetical protein [Actinoplanes lutulentus]MBB2948177.1 hypothetical protein [Actinoplanes lutulentus]RAK31323.1 hypothetical protein B0I29_115129 [Actinoplanes lutulentus]